MEDSAIVELFLARDEAAIAHSEVKYHRYLEQIAYNILYNRQDAEECVNDTWIRAWGAIPPHRPTCLGAFLGKIVRNLALDRYKAEHTEKRGGGEFTLSLDELAEVLPDAEQELREEELGAAISAFLRTQKPLASKIFVCRYFYAESIADIGERFGFSESKIKSILFRVRNRLKEYLEKEGIEV